MKHHLAAITALALLLPAAPGIVAAQSQGELKNEIDSLKQGQKAIQEDLEEIKKLLKARPTGPGQPAPFKPANISLKGSHIKGNPDAKVTLVEYTDYQCQFCRRHFEQVMPEIVSNYVEAGKLRYVVRQFPLTQIHSRAARASQAALCAGDQGQYWEMHRRIYQEQGKLADHNLLEHAEALGLELAEFENCLEEGRHREKVRADQSEGSRVGVRGTPSFLLGLTNSDNPDELLATEYLRGAQPYESFQAAIDKLLAADPNHPGGRTAE